MRKESLVIMVAQYLFCGSLSAQGLIQANDYISDYLRIQEVLGNYKSRPIFVHQNQFLSPELDSINRIGTDLWHSQINKYENRDSDRLSFTVLSPSMTLGYNTKYSRSYNDGPIWNGRGLSSSLNAGFSFKWGKLKGVFYPNFSYSQNRPFRLQESLLQRSEFSYQLDDRIDWVQRYGNSAFKEFHLGQSSISVETGPITFALSSENMWWGPSLQNSILMTNNAPGFPHLDIGTKRPLRTKAGDFEFHSFWGMLKESDYFDDDSDNDRRYLAALTFGYRPTFSTFLEGLSFGLGRVLYQPWPRSGLSFGDIFLGFRNFDGSSNVTSNGLSNDDTDQMVSLNTRWFFERVGFEIYYEYARNDFWLNFKDLVAEPDHGAVFTIGFQKVFKSTDNFWKLGFEHISLTTTRTIEVRNSHSIYLHTIARQGYTHRGQLIGAPGGPASKNQLLTLSKYNKKGRMNFSIQRIRFDDDFVFRETGRTGRDIKHDVELTYSGEIVHFFKNYEISASMAYSRRSNWHFDEELDVNNFQIVTGIRWHITSTND